MAAIVAPLQMMIGDTVARTVFQQMPVKFAAIEIVWNDWLRRAGDHPGPTEPGHGRHRRRAAHSRAWRRGCRASARRQSSPGLSTVPRENQPPANIVHWAWDGMVFGGTAWRCSPTWFLLYWIVRRRLPGTRWFYRCAAVAGVLSVFCVECGWIVTEVGRQPWIVYNFLRTADAVTNAGIVRADAGHRRGHLRDHWRGHGADAARHVATLGGGRADSCRVGHMGRSACAPVDGVAASSRRRHGGTGGRMSLADLVAAVLLLAVTAYAVLGGADFGAGFWDLVAGGTREGAAPRALINRAVGPVWEVNHVWLIFCLVVLWTAFPPAFGSIMTTLSIPLSLALLGIVLRGAGFAFRHEAERLSRSTCAGRRIRHLVGADAVLLRDGHRRHCLRARAGRQRGRRSGHELAEPDVGGHRAAGRRRRARTWPPCSWSPMRTEWPTRTSRTISAVGRSWQRSSPD